MRIVSYRIDGEAAVGIVVDDNGLLPVSEIAPDLPNCLMSILEIDPELVMLRKAAAGATPSMTLDDVDLDPVIPNPNSIWALALNFHSHIKETGLTTSDKYPHIFLRHAASQVGGGQPLLCPDPEVAKGYDYEGELAVIIGRGGRHIPVDRALEHVAGFSIYNEGSVREFQGHNRQFGLGKNFEKSGSFGPWMMTPDEFGDIYEKTISTRLNGVTRQHESIGGSLFKVEELIHYISIGYQLRPGDVIVCGTPGALKPESDDAEAQLGAHFDHVQFAGRVHMKPGDICEVEISGLGVLRNPIAADIPPEYTVY